MLFIILLFNYLNNNRIDLIFKYLSLTNEIQSNDKINGITIEQNESFWLIINKINLMLKKFFDSFTIFTCLSFNTPLLFMRYGEDLNTFIPMVTIIFIHYSIYIFLIFSLQNYFNLFYLELLFFFRFKFDNLNKLAEELDRNMFKNYNKKLTRLINDFNSIYLECILMNDLFKNIIYTNYVHYFVFMVCASFASLNGDLNLKIGLFLIIFIWLVTVLLLPFNFGNGVAKKVSI
jgi:hypothetical protein